MNRSGGRKTGSGFTLAEMMLTLALVAVVYGMISTILIQISRYVKSGREVARERHRLLKGVEELRYQLRSLYYPNGSPGLIGQRTPLDGGDTLRFITTNGRIHKGVVEVGYQLERIPNPEDPSDQSTNLYYREFPFRRQELRTLTPQQEATWEVMMPNVELFELEYSSGGQVWQREWDAPQAPAQIRVRLARGGENRDRIMFAVTPGVGAGRW